uniref:ADAM17 membrane-proximal domain-containing protein n=1 Tax=Romanomermis culicivorax TaxID=13658 RepID=A0A915II30_ROMCU
TESCFLCCRPLNSTACKPFVRFPTYPTYRILTDGTRCIFGHCRQGTCMKDAQDFIEHVWSIVGKKHDLLKNSG